MNESDNRPFEERFDLNTSAGRFAAKAAKSLESTSSPTEKVVYGILGGCVALLAVVGTVCLAASMLQRVF